MKRKVLYQKIDNAFEMSIPDVYSKINYPAIDLPPRPEPSAHSRPNWRQVLRYSMSFMVLFAVVALGIQLAMLFPQVQYHPLESETELIGFQTLSALTLLESDSIDELSYRPDTLSESVSTDFTTDELDLINDYLNMLEVTLGDTNSSSYQMIASDRDAFQYCLQIRRVDLLNQQTENRFYFNRTETDESISVEGVVTHSEGEYEVTGLMAQITSENSSFFRVELNEFNSVTVYDQSDSVQQKFTVRVLRSGQESETVEIALESSRNLLKASLKMTIAQKQIALRVEKNKANDGFDIDYETQVQSQKRLGNIEVQITYDDASQKYMYQYTFKARQGESQPDYQGDRRKGQHGQPTTTMPETTQDNTTTTSEFGHNTTQLPSTNRPDSSGFGTSASNHDSPPASTNGPGTSNHLAPTVITQRRANH
jgi:hypothetical protein